jgi:hypothetical protein
VFYFLFVQIPRKNFLLDPVEQVADLHPYGLGQPHDVVEARVPVAVFDSGQSGSVNEDLSRKVRLRNPRFAPRRMEVVAEPLRDSHAASKSNS